MNKTIFLTITFFLSNFLSLAINHEKVNKLINKQKYERVETLLEKFSTEKNYTWYYLTAKLAFENGYEKNSLEQAYTAINQASILLKLNGEDEKGTSKEEVDHLKKIIDHKYLTLLKTKNKEELDKISHQFPESEVAEAADAILHDKEYSKIMKSTNLQEIKNFILSYPQHPHLNPVIELQYELAFENAVSKNDIISYDHFINNYPEADQIQEALKMRNSLAYILALETEKTVANTKIEKQNARMARDEAIKTALQAERRTLWITVGILSALGITIALALFFIRKDKQKINKQRDLIQKKNREIVDSINYAKRIQKAFLPNIETLNPYFEDSFIIYQPKHIVSGDFYWTHEKDGNIYFAVADCTGHGVPGALVSMIGHSGLNTTVDGDNLSKTNEILDKLRERVINAFSSKEVDLKDGMDIGLGCYNKTTLELEFSGAYNGAFILRKDEIIELSADKQPIGLYRKMQPFNATTFQLEKGDQIYITTDGYIDQFGGAKKKKFMKKQFKSLIIETKDLSLGQQKEALVNAFKNWKGDIPQIDDVCLMGLRV